MIFDLLLKGGELPGAAGAVDVGIRDGLVMAIGRYLSSDKLCPVYDVRGKWVLPGLVDLWQSPGAGEVAARGGVTLACVRTQAEVGVSLEGTLARASVPQAIDYCFSYRVLEVPSEEAIVRAKAAGLAALAFSFTELDDAQAAELLLRAQAAKIAVFFLPEHPSYLRDSVRNGTLKRMGAAPTPTEQGEALMVARAIAIAGVLQAPLHILGVSTASALRRVRAAKKSGVPVTASVFAHNLLLHRGLYRWRRGLWYRPQPPLRAKTELPALWRTLGAASIVLGGAPRGVGPLITVTQESPMPIAESGPRALLKRAQRSHRRPEGTPVEKSLPRMIARVSESPAALLGFARERAPLVIGSVADIAVFDPHASEILGPRRPKDASEWEPLVGVRALPLPVLVVRRGRVVVDEKGVRSEPGRLSLPLS